MIRRIVSLRALRQRHNFIWRFASLFTEAPSFALAEWLGQPLDGTYRPCGARYRVVVRHGGPDLFIAEELFGSQVYEPPPPVASMLRLVRRPLRILDLGAHTGLFGAWAFGRFDVGELTSYEPDAHNLAILHRTIGLNGLGDRWRVNAVCAGNAIKEVAFVGGQYSTSFVTSTDDARSEITPMLDVLPALACVDLAKIDVEGSEWMILDDPRFTTCAPRALVLEYHAIDGSLVTARGRAVSALTAAGFEVKHIEAGAAAAGMLWAYRP